MVSVTTWILILTIAIILVIIVFMYNSLIRVKNEVENAWAQIDVQLKRRTDLIPNLVETVKGYAKHEKTVFEEVTKARTEMINAGASGDVKKIAKAENALSGTLKSLFAVSEAYPDLKANQNFILLQEELTGTENKVAASRQYYNDMVMEYNMKIESFPTNFMASTFHFTHKDLFEIPESEKAVPKVSF